MWTISNIRNVDLLLWVENSEWRCWKNKTHFNDIFMGKSSACITDTVYKCSTVLYLTIKLDDRDSSSADTAWNNQTNPWVTWRYLSFWSPRPTSFMFAVFLSVWISEDGAVHSAFSTSTLAVLPCETITCVMDSGSRRKWQLAWAQTGFDPELFEAL